MEDGSEEVVEHVEYGVFFEMPPVYKIGFRRPDSEWMETTWCNAAHMVSLINRHYGLEWGVLDLLARFGLPMPKEPTGFKRFRLHVLELPEESSVDRIAPQVYRFSKKLIERYYRKDKKNRNPYSILTDVFVPAYWAQNVCMAMMYGGRRLKMVIDLATGKRRMAVVDEDHVFCQYCSKL